MIDAVNRCEECGGVPSPCAECARLREQLAESEAANESYEAEAKMAREALERIRDGAWNTGTGMHFISAREFARAALGVVDDE